MEVLLKDQRKEKQKKPKHPTHKEYIAGAYADP